jgi:hypothetical protein
VRQEHRSKCWTKYPNSNKNIIHVLGITLATEQSRSNGSWEKAMTQNETTRDELIAEILRYVVAHPDAKDTIDGIEKWWLSKSTKREGKRKTEEALNFLAVKGWLNARSSPQSETIYSLNENSAEEIDAFLKDTS